MLIKAEKIQVPLFIYLSIYSHVNLHVEASIFPMIIKSKIFLFALKFFPFNQFLFQTLTHASVAKLQLY